MWSFYQLLNVFTWIIHLGTRELTHKRISLTVRQTWVKTPFITFIIWAFCTPTLIGKRARWYFGYPDIRLTLDPIFNRPWNTWIFPFSKCAVTQENVHRSHWGRTGITIVHNFCGSIGPFIISIWMFPGFCIWELIPSLKLGKSSWLSIVGNNFCIMLIYF